MVSGMAHCLTGRRCFPHCEFSLEPQQMSPRYQYTVKKILLYGTMKRETIQQSLLNVNSSSKTSGIRYGMFDPKSLRLILEGYKIFDPYKFLICINYSNPA